MDLNQKLIVEAVRKYCPSNKVTIQVTSGVGKGFPDLAVGVNGENQYWEIKSPGGKLTPDQVKWHAAWAGNVKVVTTVWEALSMAGASAQIAVEVDRLYRDRYPEAFGEEAAARREASGGEGRDQGRDTEVIG